MVFRILAAFWLIKHQQLVMYVSNVLLRRLQCFNLFVFIPRNYETIPDDLMSNTCLFCKFYVELYTVNEL